MRAIMMLSTIFIASSKIPIQRYFWVVSQFSDMKTEEAYRCQTGMTAVMGITVIIVLFVISLFI